MLPPTLGAYKGAGDVIKDTFFPNGSALAGIANGVKGAATGLSASPSIMDGLNNFLNPKVTAPSPGSSPGSYGGSYEGSSGSSAPELDYLYADLAKHYGMSAESAYQEALSNTSYQRSVKDMQAAGLNPAAIFGAGRGTGADGVSYVSRKSSGGSSGGYFRGSAQQNNKLFSEGAYHGISTIAGLIGMGVTHSPTGYWIGQSTAQGIMGALNNILK